MQAKADHALPGRNCGDCTLCCKLLKIDALDKPRGVWCAHCRPASGCALYAERPDECRDFYCGFLTNPEMGEPWRPSRSKIVVALELGGKRISAYVDPQRPDAWRREPYYGQLKRWAVLAAPHRQIVVWIGSRVHVILPDRDVDLGLVSDDEIVATIERTTPFGSELDAFKIHKDDPRARDLLARA